MSQLNTETTTTFEQAAIKAARQEIVAKDYATAELLATMQMRIARHDRNHRQEDFEIEFDPDFNDPDLNSNFACGVRVVIETRSERNFHAATVSVLCVWKPEINKWIFPRKILNTRIEIQTQAT